MNTILLIALACIAFLLFFAMASFFTWLFIEKYFINRKYLKVTVLMSSGDIKPLMAKKIEEQKKIKGEMYSACRWRELTWFYKPEQVKKFGSRYGFFAYEKNFFALDIDFRSFDNDSKMTIHPKIMTDILTTKLISELLEKESKLELILLIVCIGLLIIVGILVFYLDKQILDKLTGISGQLTELLKLASPKKTGLI